MMDLHGQIINIQTTSKGIGNAIETAQGIDNDWETRLAMAYKLGHRDARHAAAELSLAVTREHGEARASKTPDSTPRQIVSSPVGMRINLDEAGEPRRVNTFDSVQGGRVEDVDHIEGLLNRFLDQIRDADTLDGADFTLNQIRVELNALRTAPTVQPSAPAQSFSREQRAKFDSAREKLREARGKTNSLSIVHYIIADALADLATLTPEVTP